MSTRLPPPKGPHRYSQESVVTEIERYLQRMPRGTQKRLASAAGMEPDDFSHRMSGRYAFTVEQVGAIADEASAPTAWPWISWELGEAFDGFMVVVDGARRDPPRPKKPPRD